MAQTSTEWLEQAYPHMRPIAKAPTFDELRVWADQRGASVERTMLAEGDKWYSAARKSGESFEAYKVRNNAALMAWAIDSGKPATFVKAQPMGDYLPEPSKKKNLFR